jgi:hypothetical protein
MKGKDEKKKRAKAEYSRAMGQATLQRYQKS